MKGEINGNGVRLSPLKERDNSRIIQVNSANTTYTKGIFVEFGQRSNAILPKRSEINTLTCGTATTENSFLGHEVIIAFHFERNSTYFHFLL